MTRNEALKEIGEGLARVAAAILVFAEEGEKPEPREAKKEEPKAAELEKKEEPKATEPEKKEEPKPAEPEKKEEPKATEPEKKEEPKAEPEKKYTMEDVRKALSAKSGAGYTAEVRALLEKHGGSKLSAIDEAEYPAIMEEVQAIGSTQ